MSLGKI